MRSKNSLKTDQCSRISEVPSPTVNRKYRVTGFPTVTPCGGGRGEGRGGGGDDGGGDGGSGGCGGGGGEYGENDGHNFALGSPERKREGGSVRERESVCVCVWCVCECVCKRERETLAMNNRCGELILFIVNNQRMHILIDRLNHMAIDTPFQFENACEVSWWASLTPG